MRVMLFLVAALAVNSAGCAASAPDVFASPPPSVSEFGIAGTVTDVRLANCPAGICTGPCNCASQDKCGPNGGCQPKLPPLPVSRYAAAYESASRGTPTAVTLAPGEVVGIDAGTWVLSRENGRVVGRRAAVNLHQWSPAPLAAPASWTCGPNGCYQTGRSR